jgi:hypothetical protein
MRQAFDDHFPAKPKGSNKGIARADTLGDNPRYPLVSWQVLRPAVLCRPVPVADEPVFVSPQELCPHNSDESYQVEKHSKGLCHRHRSVGSRLAERWTSPLP